MSDEAATKISKDLRLDRLITWAMMAMVGALSAVASYAFSDLKAQIGGLSREVSALNINMALMEQQKENLRKIEATQEKIKDQIQALELWRARSDPSP